MSAGPVRVVQYWSPEKDAEFAGMSAADRLAWLDEVRLMLWASVASASSVSDGKPPRP